MGYLKGYEFIDINKMINKNLRLKREIKINFNCWDVIKKEGISISEKLTISVNKEKETISKDNLNVKFNSLTEEDNNKLNDYLNKYGNYLLDYELRKIDHKELINLLNK